MTNIFILRGLVQVREPEQCEDRAGQAGGTYGLERTGPHGSLPRPGLKQQAGGVLA